MSDKTRRAFIRSNILTACVLLFIAPFVLGSDSLAPPVTALSAIPNGPNGPNAPNGELTVEPDPEAPKETVQAGQTILVLAGAASLALLAIVFMHAIPKRHRPKYSSSWLLLFP